MRTISAAQERVISGSGRGEHMRVSVKDSGGTWRDLTTYPGYNMVISAQWGETMDDPHATAAVTLRREVDRLSLAPLMLSSPLNMGFDPVGAYAALLAVNREVKIEVAIVPMDKSPGAGDWMNVFHGRIDKIDPGAGDEVTLEARDLGGALADCFIQTEYVYAFLDYLGTHYSASVFQPAYAYVMDELVLPSEANRNGKYYQVTTAGTSGATEPVWPTSGTVANGAGALEFTQLGDTSTAGYDAEEVMQTLIDDHLGGVTLDVPSGSGFSLLPYIQSRTTLLDALQTIAIQRGWAVRYKWDSGSTSFLLTFFEPDRAKVVEDRGFSKSEGTITAMPIDRFSIRNVVSVVYSDSADLAGDGTPVRKTHTETDATSVTAYGEMFMEIAEASTSQIDTAAEAEDMAEAAIADLKDPVMECSFELTYGFPWAELGDLYQLSADDRHFSGAKNLALFGVSHEAREGHIVTEFKLRDTKPGLGKETWLENSAHPSGKENHRIVLFENPTGASRTTTSTIGGGRIQVTGTMDKAAFGEEYEHHISTSNGFTPDSTTLVAVGAERAIEISQLTPGTTYYHTMYPRTRNGRRMVRGLPSVQTSFVAGTAKAQHIDQYVSTGLFPYNFAFEHAFRAIATYPPDRWNMSAGTWGTQALAGTDENGGRSIIMDDVAGATSVKSDFFPVTDQYYNLAGHYKTTGANAGIASFQVVIYFYKDSTGTASGTLASRTHTITTASGGVWLTLAAKRQSVPADANFASVEIKKSASASDYQIEVGDIVFTRNDIAQETQTFPTLQNSWVDYGGSSSVTGYYLDSVERVQLNGAAKDGTQTAGTLLFTLASGYRPGYEHYYAVENNGATGYIKIATNGQVTIVGVANATRLCFDGVSFQVNK